MKTFTRKLTIGEWVVAGVKAVWVANAVKDSDFGAFSDVLRNRGEMTPNDLSDAWARLQKYRAEMKAAGLGWMPAPAFEEHGPLAADARCVVSLCPAGFALRFPFGHDCTPWVRAIEGAKWKGPFKAWCVAATEAGGAAVLNLCRVAGFTMDEQAEAACAEIRHGAEETRKASRSAAGTFHVDGLVGALRPYQAAGVRYMVEARRCFNADEMGLGKTVQALAAVQALGAWPALAVTLASCKGGWLAECGRWLPGVRVVVWEGRGETEQEPVVEGERVLHVCNYDILSHRAEELRSSGFKAVVFDEIHHLKNGRAKRTLAARKLVRGVPVRFGLSGTPVQNCPSELIAPLGLLGRMDDVGGFFKFGMRYCAGKQGKHGWDFSGASNLGELHERLRGCCFVRRTKAQVLTELPAKITTRVPVGMSVEGWVKYHRAAADVLQFLADKAAIDPQWEATVAHLDADGRASARASRIAKAVERMDGMELLLRLGTLRQVVAEGKLERAKEWVREFLAGGRKLVLFGHHRAVLGSLLEEFRAEAGATLIDGATPSGKRAGLVKAFATEKTRRLMLVNLVAGGTGLDGLQRAAGDVAYIEFPWTPAGLDQATSRVHRMGQAGTVHEWLLTAPGTVDDDLLGILASKDVICAGANDGIEGRRRAAMDAARAVARGMNLPSVPDQR